MRDKVVGLVGGESPHQRSEDDLKGGLCLIDDTQIGIGSQAWPSSRSFRSAGRIRGLLELMLPPYVHV